MAFLPLLLQCRFGLHLLSHFAIETARIPIDQLLFGGPRRLYWLLILLLLLRLHLAILVLERLGLDHLRLV